MLMNLIVRDSALVLLFDLALICLMPSIWRPSRRPVRLLLRAIKVALFIIPVGVIAFAGLLYIFIIAVAGLDGH